MVGDWREGKDLTEDGCQWATWQTQFEHPLLGVQPLLIIGQGLNRVGLTKLDAEALMDTLRKFAGADS